jgi:hypothetical protein
MNVNWPEGMIPKRVPVYARNEIVIPAEPERIWWWLCHAKQWPQWYSNCSWIRISSEELALGVVFTWKTFGVVIQSRVTVFDPFTSLEWNARGLGLRAYHGWRIEHDGQSSHVITEETQTGILPSLGRWFLRGMLWRGHQIWVESLKEVVMGGKFD